MKNKTLLFFILLFISFNAWSHPFNKKISDTELQSLQNGEILIRNIDYKKNICLKADFSPLTEELIEIFNDLSPKYLAEVIQIRPYQGNEDLPAKLSELLFNVPDYAGIPYWSERNERYYDLYSSAVIKESQTQDNFTSIRADLEMLPFGTVDELIEVTVEDDAVLYNSVNLNKLTYLNKFDCVSPKKMRMCILLFRDGDNWILYGIGGVNAPRIPFFTERIETSFINRIKTFCNFIFSKI